jgi:hypothetical protein
MDMRHRIKKLESTSTRLNSSHCQRELDEFSRKAEEYIGSVRQYLGESQDSEPPMTCRSESEVMQVITRMFGYYLRAARQYRRRVE